MRRSGRHAPWLRTPGTPRDAGASTARLTRRRWSAAATPQIRSRVGRRDTGSPRHPESSRGWSSVVEGRDGSSRSPRGLWTARYRCRAGRFTRRPSRRTSSVARSARVPRAVTARPFTVTRPSWIRVSAARRDASPAIDKIFWSRIPADTTLNAPARPTYRSRAVPGRTAVPRRSDTRRRAPPALPCRGLRPCPRPWGGRSNP